MTDKKTDKKTETVKVDGVIFDGAGGYLKKGDVLPDLDEAALESLRNKGFI